MHVKHIEKRSFVTGGRTAPSDTLQGGDTRRKKSWANLQRIVEKRGRTGKKVWGDTLEGVTPESPGFSGK